MSDNPIADMARRQSEEEQEREPRELEMTYIHSGEQDEKGDTIYRWITEDNASYAFDENEVVLFREVKGAMSGHRDAEDALDDAIRYLKEANKLAGCTFNAKLLKKFKEAKELASQK